MASQQLAVIIPNDAPNPSPCLITFPLTLPMGWAHSTPYFCAFTETIADMTNMEVLQDHARPTHCLLTSSQTHAVPQTFCRDLHCDPFLTTLHDPIPILQIFANRYRTGAVALMCALTQWKMPYVPWARHLPHWDVRIPASRHPANFRLSRLLSLYKKQDPPPTRVKPVPLPIVVHAAHLCYTANTPSSNTIADMLLLGFFFLLCPGEYAFTNNPDAAPFHLFDTHLPINSCCLQPATASLDDLRRVNYVALEFTTHKNGVRGELIGLGRSSHPTWCPVKTLIHRIQHLRQHNAPPTTPLYLYFDGSWQRIDTTILTHYMRLTVTTLGQQ